MAHKVVAALALLAVVVLAAGPIDARDGTPGTAGGSPSSWIVTLGEGSDPAAEAPGLARRHGGSVGHVYEHALQGFQFHGSEQAAANLARHPRVERVEADGIATIVHHRDGHDGGPGGGGGGDDGDDGGTEPDPVDPGTCLGDLGDQTLPEGIARIGAVTSHSNGGTCVSVTGVHVYVIDTGVDAKHPDLDVVGHRNFTNGPNRDCNGHGTHVAGTAAAIDDDADVVGVAPGAPVVGVRVLNCAGSGTWSGVIAGIDWVAGHAEKPAVANLSLGGGANAAVDTAVKNLANSGVTVAVAAGNSGADACNYSPARAGKHDGVITVAATNQADAETSWSNYGSCVDIWAPGAGILSTAAGGGTTTLSGTSMSAPHVAGAAALLSGTAKEVEDQLKASAEPLTTVSKGGGTIDLVSAS